MSLSYQFEGARDLIADEPKKRRPKRIRTLGTWELETKVELRSTDQVTRMIDRIRRLSEGVSKASTREQFHTVFANDPSGYHGVVLVEGSDHVGVRSKNAGELIQDPDFPFPLYLRHETSFGPKDCGYEKHLRGVFQSRKIGSFDKRCADLAYWVGDNSFSATVSIVDVPDQRENGCYQLELEFDGHREGTTPPAADRIIADFRRAYEIAFGDTEPCTETKLGWIARQTGNEDVIPVYTPLPLKESSLPELASKAA